MGKEVKERVNCYIKPEIKQYIDEQCEFYGMSIGAFLSMVVMQHKQQSEVGSAMVKLQDMMAQLEGTKGN